jgi:hypothetical protein
LRVQRIRQGMIATGCVSGLICLVAVASGGPGFEPVLTPPVKAPANPPTAITSRTTDGVSYLSVSSSPLGRAITPTLSADQSVVAIESRWLSGSDQTIAYDRAETQGVGGDRYGVTHFRAFSVAEMDSQAHFKQGQSAAGRYWVTSDMPDLQAVTLQTARGVAIRVDHFSATPGDRVAPDTLIGMASAIAANIETIAPGGGIAMRNEAVR